MDKGKQLCKWWRPQLEATQDYLVQTLHYGDAEMEAQGYYVIDTEVRLYYLLFCLEHKAQLSESRCQM